jgi:hypothetical protein
MVSAMYNCEIIWIGTDQYIPQRIYPNKEIETAISQRKEAKTEYSALGAAQSRNIGVVAYEASVCMDWGPWRRGGALSHWQP